MPDDRSPARGSTSTRALSLVVLQWDQAALTRSCVNSLREHTEACHELIIVDNGSEAEAAAYARESADIAVCNGRNLGFGGGMNEGLRVARGEYVVFINNDTRFPARWDSRLLESAEGSSVGMVVPAVTQAGLERTVLAAPTEKVEVLAPFLAIPAGVVIMMPTEIARALGGFSADEFPIGSGEDIDLAFKVWVNDLEIVFDQRVLVDHVGHATADAKLEDRPALWMANREIFFQKWMDIGTAVPRLPHVSEQRFARNRSVAAEAAHLRKLWKDTKHQLRDARTEMRRQRRQLRRCRQELSEVRSAAEPTGLRDRLPRPVRRALRFVRHRWRA